MADLQIQGVQEWLNRTYVDVPGFTKVTEDGLTGWETMYGLREALQHELGISPVSSGFGLATKAAFTSQIGSIDESTTDQNILHILSSALWCKGYMGITLGTAKYEFVEMAPSLQLVHEDLGLGSNEVSVDVKLMASLLSMDAYKKIGSGTSEIREFQQWLNGQYHVRENFALIPADGIYSRQVQTAVLYALQYEFGMDDNTANGNFGPGTRAGLRDQAPVSIGDSDSSHHFVRLFQGLLRLNGYSTPQNGSFSEATRQSALDFQGFMFMVQNGQGDYGTWAALLVSTGDPDRAVAGFDTNKQMTAAQYADARAQGYTDVGRYTVGAGKNLMPDELNGIKNAKLRLFPIHQRFNNNTAEMTKKIGIAHGREAVGRARLLGIPTRTTIYFPVDYDPLDSEITGPVFEFFDGIKEGMNPFRFNGYSIGVYGTRNVCKQVVDAGKAERCFIAGISTGWSGNMGYTMPENWSYNQIKNTTVTFAGSSVEIDHVAVAASTGVKPEDIEVPPLEEDSSAAGDLGINVFYSWVIDNEMRSEEGFTRDNPAMGSIHNYILEWLRKPKYWTPLDEDGNVSIPLETLWHAYTPEIGIDANVTEARATVHGVLGVEGANLPPVNEDYIDVQHMAATYLGYHQWGYEIGQGDFGIGDLGGWGLDLLQIWGEYLRNGDADLDGWLGDALGKVGKGTFSYADVLCDADGWLLMKEIAKNKTITTRLSGALRSLYQASRNTRISRFFDERFGGNPDNVISAVQQLTGEAPGWMASLPSGIDDALLLTASGASRMPSKDETIILGGVFASFLSAPAG